MLDLTTKLQETITNQHIDGLDLGRDLIHPAYDGLSILNLPGSICKWFGASTAPHPSLSIPELDELNEGVDQVVVVLIDAVALHRFQEWLDDLAVDMRSMMAEGTLGALTSIVPSTTSAALTTLWTGSSPAEHGVLGYEVFLKEFGLVANMITHEPAAFRGHPGLLYRAGFDPETFIPVPTIGPRLNEAGVDVHGFLHYTISESGLSRMHYTDVTVHSYGGVPDLWVGARQLAVQAMQGSRLIWIYYGGVDNASHRFGPDSDQARADFRVFIQTMVEEFLNPIPVEVRKSTLLILLADHGQLHTRKDPHYDTNNHPGLIDRLHMQPTGENRLAYLYPKPGQLDAVEEYIQRTWPGGFTIAPSSYLLEKGLFGPGEPHPAATSRLGDRTLVSHDRHYLWWSHRENPLLGRHGGLSPEEMLVPIFALRLA